MNSVDTIVSSHVADLNLGLSDFPDPVNAGGLITYTMEISNAGPDTNSGYVWLTTMFTPALPIVRVIAPEWYAYPAGPSIWSAYGLLGFEAGRRTRVQFVVLAPSTTGVVTNTTTIWGSELEHNLDDNTRTVTTTVELGAITADIGLNQRIDEASICTASTFALTATLHNAGPEIATHPFVNIGLPEGASFTRAEGPWACAADGTGGVRCSADSLAVGASADIIIHATAPLTPSVVSVLSVAGADERDYNRDDNTHRLPLTFSAMCSTDYSVDWHTVDGGGIASAIDRESVLALAGTTGQPDAGSHRNGDMSLHGGFWQSLQPVLSPSPSSTSVWLPFVLR